MSILNQNLLTLDFLVSDHRCKADQILRRICTGGQARTHLPSDRCEARQRAT